MRDTKVVTNKVRFSYVNVFEPRKNDDGTEKYSVTLLIPKSDTATVTKINAAVKNAHLNYTEKNPKAKFPAKPNTTIHDGDGQRPSGEDFGPECKGCYVITVSSKDKPVIVDAFKQDIDDAHELYSGCYGRAAINFFAYDSHGNKGISAGLLSVQKLSDGEALGGARGSADDFDDEYEDEDLDALLG